MRLIQAAAAFRGGSHQIAAFNQLEESLAPEQVKQFFETFLAEPPTPPKCPTMKELIERHNGTATGMA